MNTPLPGFDSLFGDFFKPEETWAQKACSHVLSAKMPDGKFFCPSCRLVSAWPLVKP